jgi:hypothetical protein
MTELTSILSTTPVLYTLSAVVIFCFILVGVIALINWINSKYIKTQEVIKSSIFVVLTIIILVLGSILVMNVQMENSNNYNSFCDKKYGKDNWNQIDITGTPEAVKSVGRFYIGQVWGCEAK